MFAFALISFISLRKLVHVLQHPFLSFRDQVAMVNDFKAKSSEPETLIYSSGRASEI